MCVLRVAQSHQVLHLEMGSLSSVIQAHALPVTLISFDFHFSPAGSSVSCEPNAKFNSEPA